jgi:hypothetical protein
VNAGLADLLEFCEATYGIKVNICSDPEIDMVEVAVTLLQVVPRRSELFLPVAQGFIVVEFEEWRKDVIVF